MHEVEKYKREIAELKKQVYMLQRKDSQSQCQERNSNTQVQAVADMNAELNHLLAKAKVDLQTEQEKSRQLEKLNTKLRIKLKDTEICLVKQLDVCEQVKTDLEAVKQKYNVDVSQAGEELSKVLPAVKRLMI